jgi:hypothetical protein
MAKTARSFAMMAGILSLTSGAFVAALPTGAHAQFSCNTFIDIAISPVGSMAIGDTKMVTLSIGTGEIQSGTKVTISEIRYDLDCNGDQPLTLPCTDQGNIFRYQGDATITTTCGVTWTSNVPAGGFATNEIVFTPSSPIDIAQNTNPFCSITFGIKLDNFEPLSGADSDATPAATEVVAGFLGNAAVCDNTLPSEGSQTASIPLAAPVCGDGTVTPPETCDPPGGAQPPSGNLCRSDCTYCGDGIVNGPPSGPGHETCDTAGPSQTCNADCTGKFLRDPATITFHASTLGTDRLKVGGLLYPQVDFDLEHQAVAIRLSNANGVIYSGGLASGQLVRVKRTFKYVNKGAAKDPSGGIMRFLFFPHHKAFGSAAGYRMKMITYGDLSAATLDTMTIELVVGDSSQFLHKAQWIRTRKGGWRDSGKNELYQ